MNAMIGEDVSSETVAVLESLPMSIAILRHDGSLCYANPPAHRLAAVVHRDPERGLGWLTAAAPAPEDGGADGTEDCLKCASESGNPLVVVRQWRECGDTGMRSVTIRPAHNEGASNRIRSVSTAADAGTAPSVIDAHSLIHADKLATVGQLAAGMAHEINNPICYVQSNLGTFRDYTNKLFGLLELSGELLRDPGMSREEQQQLFKARKQAIDFATILQDLPALIEESREGVKRIRHIVQSLRDFSRSDDSETYQLYDPHRALDTTLDIVRSLGGRMLKYSTLYQSLPLIECNSTELNQLFMNILVNATHAVAADGKIDIHTRCVGKTHVEIEISDNGCGMDEHVLNHLFEPFFTTKPVGKGTGLGLSISYGIVQKHAGAIVVRSSPGRGTTFQITLPIKRPQPN